MHCRCRHKNLVELMGYCASPPMLVFEYMEQGTLHDRLFEVYLTINQLLLNSCISQKTPSLTWRERSRILKDVSHGLAWLHAVEPPIMHGDVKM